MTGLLERLVRLTAPGRAELASPPDAKASRTAALFAFHGPGEPVWTARDFRSLSHEGYEKNPVVHRCVRLVAEAVSSVPWLVFEGDAELSQHPLLKLLARPNAGMDGQRFIEAVTGYLLVAGNAYVSAQASLLAGRTWWFQLFFVVPLGAWFTAVVIDSIFQFTWNVAALPAPLDTWAGWIISSLFLVDGAKALVGRMGR